MNKSDLEMLVSIRLKEAKALLDAGLHHGAYYLSGYIIECALKACIAKQIRDYDFPNKQLAIQSHTHNLAELVRVAGLKQKLDEKKLDDEFALNWTVVKDWSESSRYESRVEKAMARDLYQAVIDEKSGVLVWLKTFW